MKTDNVTAAKKRADGSFELTITNPFEKTSSIKRYLAIRGGISWPTVHSPAYFCVVGQEYIDAPVWEKKPAGKRVLLAEYKSESLSLSAGFYGRIVDIAEQMLCLRFYVELPEDRSDCGYLSDFQNFARDKNSGVYLDAAYDTDNFQLGVSRIKGSIDSGALIVPEDSIVYQELRIFAKSDLDDLPEERFHAVNGLRHVVGSYFRRAPSNSPIRTTTRPAVNWRVA
jgi:hypothetical protein